ncbi:hypothetical protein EYF80_032081 [Liparis tanakae]|uniref:Uncharacterized protein n=1 Tax=Liparis tanakae TaxID=230148 RepID=A0A4Z2GY65_9TELE|nr:hypothetical protein EYF80_032081 [Liparis tanakae]
MARAGQVRRESVETEMYKSEDKTFVYTKKKGYDVARNPSLNKVSVEAKLREFSANFSERESCCLQVPSEIVVTATTTLDVMACNSSA